MPPVPCCCSWRTAARAAWPPARSTCRASAESGREEGERESRGMLVALDSGHTNVVFAIFDGETLRAKWRAPRDAKRTAAEYAVWLTQLMPLQRMSTLDLTGASQAQGDPEGPNYTPDTHN